MLRHLDVVAHGLRFYGALIGAVSAIGAAVAGGAGLLAGEPAVLLVAPIVFALGALIAAPFIVTGDGLLRGRPWARISGIVLSALIITDFPIGMSLGLLGLGVLLDDEVTKAFANETVANGSLESDLRRERALASMRAQSQRIAAG